jgi:branched-chain amino acid transport system permease protein
MMEGAPAAPPRAEVRPIPPAVAALARLHRPRAIELLPWLAALAAYVVVPDYLSLGRQIVIMILFALSLDLLLGYAGVVTLGHAAFFGLGAYTAGILAARHVTEPLIGLVAAGALAGLAGLASGTVILRTRGLTLLMLTLAILFMLAEGANKAYFLTGGADGLQGIVVDPVLGLFPFDVVGRTAYLYSLAILFLAFLVVRQLIYSPFGRSLTGIRENAARMEAIGAPVRRRLIIVYAISAALAGLAGALNTQATQFVALNTLSLELSGAVLIMLIVGGPGRLYGAFIGAPLYMIAHDYLARLDPTYWFFWIGLLLVAIVMFSRGGLLGLVDQLGGRAALTRR